MSIALVAPFPVFSAGDLVLSDANVRLSTNTLLEGRLIRIYASVVNVGDKDLRGFVRFYDGNKQISADQPISVVAGKDDAVFIDWEPDNGDHNLRVVLVPFEPQADNPNNNQVQKAVTVLADTDRDGIPNSTDPDDDNDGVPDDADAFPLNKNEQLDTDGDSIGNTADEDDDNDGVKDAEDGVPLNPKETVDTDKDGLGDNEDADDDGDGLSDLDEVKRGTNPLKLDTDGDTVNDKDDAYPLDPKQARDFDRDGISDALDKDADNDGIPKQSDVNDTNKGPVVVVTSGNSSGGSVPTFIFPGETIVLKASESIDPDGVVTKVQWERTDTADAGAGDVQATLSPDSPLPSLIAENREQGGVEATAQGTSTLAVGGGAHSVQNAFTTRYATTGHKTIVVRVTDDKGEIREKIVDVYVVPPYTPWIVIPLLFCASILAIFLFFSYSKRRPQPKVARHSNRKKHL